MEGQQQPLVLRTGRTVWVRPVRRSDAADLQRAFALLSDMSRYQRFLTGTAALSDRVALYFSDVDHSTHEALLAFPEEGGTEIVGVARFIRPTAEATDADLAITVANDWQGRGLATALLDLLCDRARRVGVRRFTVEMLASNDAVRRLIRGAGGADEQTDGAIISTHVDLELATLPVSAPHPSRVGPVLGRDDALRRQIGHGLITTVRDVRQFMREQRFAAQPVIPPGTSKSLPR